jgi:hypothetical protein
MHVGQQHELKEIGKLLLHTTIATVGVAISANFVFLALQPILTAVVPSAYLAPHAAFVVWLFPWRSLIALGMGALLAVKAGEFGRSRTACFAWVIPAAWFAIFLVTKGPLRWEFLFRNSDIASRRVQLVVTLPLLTSGAYAIGNYLALRCAGRYTRIRL